MAYNVYLTRARCWAQNEHARIAPEEWLHLARNDPELRPDPAGGPCCFLWRDPVHRTEHRLDWREGNIVTTNPTGALVDRLVAMAQQLGGQVQGAAGEIYEGGGKIPYFPRPPLRERLRTWFRRLPDGNGHPDGATALVREADLSAPDPRARR